MNQLENCQARYRSNTWMGQTRTDCPDEFEPTKFDCTLKAFPRYSRPFSYALLDIFETFDSIYCKQYEPLSDCSLSS